KENFATKEDLSEVSKSINELSAKISEIQAEDVSKSVDTEEQAETGEAKSEEAEEVQEDNTFKGLSQEERTKFMDSYKAQAKDPRASKHDLQSAYQSYLNINTDPTNASEKDIKTVKDFAQI
ncbi:hypothetical protein ACR2YW_28045, partial [Klebsiella pneumoniae]